MTPPGIYVSVPFCAQKCTYCNFRSGVFADRLRIEYVRCLAREIREADLADGETLYLGGGSPSLLDPDELAAILRPLRCVRWREATIEIAPGEATPSRITAWVSSGITRASLGVQSFDSTVARASGRRHDSLTVRDDRRRLADAGIRNLSVDLIAGLAHQTMATWQHSLDWVARLDVDHVSVYMLERDDDSRLGRELRSGGRRYGASHVPNNDETVDLYLWAVDRLAELGYERYEISNFARPGRRSRHNLKYWRMDPYLGFGSDAHSFSGRRRWRNVPTAGEYVRRMAAGRSPLAVSEDLDRVRLMEDRVLTGLRTRDGVQLEPAEWQALEPGIARLEERSWAVASRPSLRLTGTGMLFADQAVLELLG